MAGRRLQLMCLAVAVVASTLAGLSTATAAADDPNAAVAYQHDAAHDGNSLDPTFDAPLTEAWAAQLDGTVGYPLIVGGRVFVTVTHASGHGVDVEALSLATGERLWGPTSVGGTYGTGLIAYDGGRVFAVNDDGGLTAMDAETGAFDWTKQLAGQYMFTSPPTAVDGVVYVGGAGSGGTLYAVEGASGKTIWTAPVMNGDDSSPAVGDGGVYVSYACEQTYRFDLSGALVWHHDTECEGGGGRTPVLHDGKLYIRDAAGMSPAVLDASTGEPVGFYSSDPTPAFAGRHVATVSAGRLTVSDTSSGSPIWHTTGSDYTTAPLIANGYVIEGRADGTVEARLVQDGRLAWSGQAGARLSGTRLTGLAEGDGALAVPAGSTLTVFVPAGDTTVNITDGPGPGAFVGSVARFGFTSGVRNARYECTLDGETEPCTSPITFTGLDHGSHRFSVSIAHASTGAASRTFRTDIVAPTVRVSPFRPSTIHRRTVTARWAGSDLGSGLRGYQSRTRAAHVGSSLPSWSVRAQSTQTSAPLSIRRHSRLCISVRAQDRVGSWSAWSPAQCVRRR